MFKIFPATLTQDKRKVPIKEAAPWKENATNDQSVIDFWSSNYGHKIKFWAIPTGFENGILVLDVDVKSGGLETIKKYHVPQTMSQTTMSGGKHYIFKYPNDGKNYGNRAGFDLGLDIRGEGGYIISYGLDSTPIADAPDWLLQEALTEKKQEVNLEDAVMVDPEIVNKIVEECCDNIRNAPEGESNNILNVEAYKVGQLVTSGSIDHQTAYNKLYEAAIDRGKPSYEAQATINSGLSGGAKNPLTCPFGKEVPTLYVKPLEIPVNERWTPSFFSKYDLTNFKKLRKPQIFKNWSTEDIHLTTADGGTGKTTLKLYEAICLALGESFLGFECVSPGRTLFITGEDTKEKLGAMIGAICKQMEIINDKEKMKTVLNSVLVKKDSDLCLITKTRDGFIHLNNEALEKVKQAVDDIRPKMIVFDPISSFWGSESSLNDMAKAVAKFMSELTEYSGACVEIINHMGKASSASKDMSQFAGRGGTGLPSHSRVSRVLFGISSEEFQEKAGYQLQENQSSLICNVNKFSDGSPLFNEPFLIVREGFLFNRVTIIEQKVKEEQDKLDDTERVFNYIKTERNKGMYPNFKVVTSHFQNSANKISKDRIDRAINWLMYEGHMGEKIRMIDNVDLSVGGKCYTIYDCEGNEMDFNSSSSLT